MFALLLFFLLLSFTQRAICVPFSGLWHDGGRGKSHVEDKTIILTVRYYYFFFYQG